MVFVFQATLQDMIKVSSNMGSTLKRLVTFLQFGGHRHCGSRDIIVLASHVIAQNHAIKGPCDFMCRNPS